MPTGIARYWDSLESAEFLEPCQQHTSSIQLDDCQKLWLSELSVSAENECHSILYAKSLLEDSKDSVPIIQEVPPVASVKEARRELVTKKLASVNGVRRESITKKCSSLSSSAGNLSSSPKLQKKYARLKSAQGTPLFPPFTPVQSTLDLIDSYKFHDGITSSSSHMSSGHVSCIHLSGDVDSLKQESQLTKPFSTGYTWTPPGFRCSDSSVAEFNAESSSTHVRQPPAYDQLRIKVERNGLARLVVSKKTAFRHTIPVNHEECEPTQYSCGMSCNRQSFEVPRVPPHAPSSPKSMHSDSTLSVDSGQCSGDVALTSQHSISSSREEKEEKDISEDALSIFHVYQQRCLPGYARIASTMDHILRTASSIYSLISGPSNPSTSRELLEKTSLFIQIVEASPCAPHLPKYDANVVKLQINDLEREAAESELPLIITNYFTIVLRKMVEQVLQIFCKIIARYLTECGNKDRLVLIALEHLIHLTLFGDELCLEAIQCGGLHSVLKLVRQTSTPPDTCKLLLRALAVLCGVSKGCLSLLALGGLDVILSHLSGSCTSASIEAAGVLTQLTNPQHSFVQLHSVRPILIRLLDLIDNCNTGETLLLVSAALSNVSMQDPQAVDVLYQNNAIIRLINAYNRQDCSTIFVQEQIVTVLSRLAARRYEEALVSQGAVPVLLEMLTVTDSQHSDYCRRIRYKAAVCIGTLAATGIGLKSLYVNQAYAILTHVLQMEGSPANPLNMICTNIRNRLESKYQIESAV